MPALADNAGNWNLMHFQGGAPGALRGLWDVSLGSADDGRLFLQVFDFLRGTVRLVPAAAAPPIPIGAWFHVEFRLRRAADGTGEVALYQDGALLLTLTAIATDDTDFGQWYVGNFANALTPTDSTVYVDDVTIGSAPRGERYGRFQTSDTPGSSGATKLVDDSAAGGMRLWLLGTSLLRPKRRRECHLACTELEGAPIIEGPERFDDVI